MASPARSCFKTAATPRNDADREGDATTTTTDYNTDSATDRQTTLQEYSYHHRITDYHQTSTNISRVTASKKPRKKSPEPAKDRPILCCYDAYEEPFLIQEKYAVQDALSNKLHGKDVAIIKAQRLPREEDEMNIDLPAYFLHRPWKQDWLFIKGPTSKYFHEEFYNKMEELAESGKSQLNIISWFGFLERTGSDPSGKYRYVRVAPR